jgi:hypothetical protein
MKKLLRKILLELEQNSLPNPVPGYSRIPSGGEFGVTRDTNVHKGLDIAVPCGTDLLSPADGTVSDVAFDDNPCGQRIKIKHYDFETLYCHLEKVSVKKGDKVYQGDKIGTTGGDPNKPSSGRSSNCHLHFALKLDGGDDFIDPKPYLNLGMSADKDVQEDDLIAVDSQHNNISYLQCFLKVAGFGDFNTITDTFDQNTSDSLKKFQDQIGKNFNSGKLTSNTIRRIGRYIKNMTPDEKQQIKDCYSSN